MCVWGPGVVYCARVLAFVAQVCGSLRTQPNYCADVLIAMAMASNSCLVCLEPVLPDGEEPHCVAVTRRRIT